MKGVKGCGSDYRIAKMLMMIIKETKGLLMERGFRTYERMKRVKEGVLYGWGKA